MSFSSRAEAGLGRTSFHTFGRRFLLLFILLGIAISSAQAFGTRPALAGDGIERVRVLVYNGVAATEGGQVAVQNDVDHLEVAFAADSRPISILESGAANFAALSADIAAHFGAAAVDDDDVCIFYYGGHGGQRPDANADEADGKDGLYSIRGQGVYDDNWDTPFNAIRTANKCGAGMILMFMACSSGELIVGANDFAVAAGALGAQDVVLTSCNQAEASSSGTVGGHDHSLYGGAAILRGISDTNANGIAEADANANGAVTVAELQAYAVANDNDAGAVPQALNGASALRVLVSAAPAAHGAAVVVGGGVTFCNISGVGGIAEPSALESADQSAVPPSSDGSAWRRPQLAIAAGGFFVVVLLAAIGARYLQTRRSTRQTPRN